MSAWFSHLRHLQPMSVLRLYMFVVIAAAAVGVGIVMHTSTKVESNAHLAGTQAQASIKASELQAGMGGPIVVWSAGFWSIFQDPAFLALPPQQRGLVNAEIFRDFYDFGAPTPGLPPIEIKLTDKELIDFQRAIDGQLRQLDALIANAEGVDTTQLQDYRTRIPVALDAYFVENSIPKFRDVFALMIVTQTELGTVSNQLAALTSASQVKLDHATEQARLFSLAALAGLATTMIIATFYVTRLIQRAFRDLETEKAALSDTTNSLQHRNSQLSALYNVFAEITDTLSLRYVVDATLREARNVMGAEMTVLRLLRGNELIVAGAVRADGTPITNLPSVNLGEGPTGRTAKRGRTMRIDTDAQELMNATPTPTGEPAPRPSRGDMESGVIAPLIVGARVVGTIACWSRAANAFTTEDERVLEMMASQVATAVAAADATERSERRAHQDALTGLPNRLQLNEDIDGDVKVLAQEGRRAVVAMADIDNFKLVNDEHSHKVGDVTLQKIGAILRSSVRDNDRVYRYGGEEFVLIFLDTGPEEAVALAERVRSTLEQTPFSGDQLEPVGPITISIGLAALPDHGIDLEALIELADAAMYQAKQLGRNRVVLWDDDLPHVGSDGRATTHAA